MTTVRDTFAQLERQYLGTGGLCSYEVGKGSWSDLHNIQYEITGPDGGSWHLAAVGWDDDFELSEGLSPDPDVIVRASAEDWLALWAGQESAQGLLDSGRVSVIPVGEFAEALRIADTNSTAEFPTCLTFLGVLGPLQELEPTALSRMPLWLQEPREEPSYPPSLEGLHFRSGKRQHAVQPVGESELGDEARPVVEAAARLSLRVNRLRAARRWLGPSAIASVPVGIGISFLVSPGQLAAWLFLASLLLPYPAYILLRDLLRKREDSLEARLLPWVSQSPRVFMSLLESGLIEHVGGGE